MKMKSIWLVLVCFIGFSFYSCSESKSTSLNSQFNEANKVEAIVIKDCTGAYLRMNNKDYLICNDDTIEKYNNEEIIYVTYKIISDCDWSERVVCEMYHEKEGLIEITGIK